MKRPIYERCLITEARKFGKSDPKFWRDSYLVSVLQAKTANMATRTGIGSTIVMTAEQMREFKKMHGLRTLKSMFGAPVICKVEFGGGNILGSSRFHKNTY